MKIEQSFCHFDIIESLFDTFCSGLKWPLRLKKVSKAKTKAKKRKKKQGWKKTNLESQVSLMKTKEGTADKGQINSE